MGWIRSKPTYAPLVLVNSAGLHLLASDGAGADAVLRALGETPELREDFHWLHCSDSTGDAHAAELKARFNDRINIAQTWEALGDALDDALTAAPAGVAVYLAGSEQFIWHCAAHAQTAGCSRQQIHQELCGSSARRVYCVHCKAVAPAVTTSTYQCSGCGQVLFVRDHFSRQLQCFAGVRADAEEPGAVPTPVEVFT